MSFLPDLIPVTIAGRRLQCGTAADIAAHIGGEVTAEHVEDWGQRGLIERWNVPGQGRGTTYFDLGQASKVELRTRIATRGKKRQLDSVIVLA